MKVEFLIQLYLSFFKENSVAFGLSTPLQEACKEVGKLELFDQVKVFQYVLRNNLSLRVVRIVSKLFSKGSFVRIRTVLGPFIEG